MSNLLELNEQPEGVSLTEVISALNVGDRPSPEAIALFEQWQFEQEVLLDSESNPRNPRSVLLYQLKTAFIYYETESNRYGTAMDAAYDFAWQNHLEHYYNEIMDKIIQPEN